MSDVQEAVTNQKLEALNLAEVKDSDWICSCFVGRDYRNSAIGGDQVSFEVYDYEKESRYYTNTIKKVGGSGIGEGRVLNMPPGINEFCDIPMGYSMDGKQNANGMGVFYSEGLDDNLDVIHIRPGVPRYSSLARFYTSSVNASAVSAAEYGWFDRTVNAVATAAANLVLLPFKLVMTPFNVIGRALSNDDTNRFSYYYLAPATHTYWNAMDTMINDFAVRSNLIPGASYADSFDDGSQATKVMRDDDVDWFVKNLPGVYRAGNVGVPRIDIFAISTRYGIMQNARKEAILGKINSISEEDSVELNEDYIRAYESIMMDTNPFGEDSIYAGTAKLEELKAAYQNAHVAMTDQQELIMTSALSDTVDAMQNAVVTVNEDGETDTVLREATVDSEAQHKIAPEMDSDDFTKNFEVVASLGADWVSLAVDHVTESTISISNTSGPSGLAGMLNGMVSSARNVNFNLAGGNLGDDALSNFAEGALKTVSSGVSGMLGGLVGGLPSALLGGKAFIDIPDVYQESTMEFNRLEYTLTSVSTSGHPLAKLRMLMPYFALLCMAAPRSAGASSYTQPFLVEVQHKGRGIVQLGLIDSLSATFGEMDGWDINDIPNKVTINFSIVNLSKGFHIPLDAGISQTYADTGEFAVHMSVLAGTSLTDRDRSLFYNLKRTGMRLGQTIDKYTSASYWAHMTGSALKSVDPGLLPIFGYYTNRR